MLSSPAKRRKTGETTATATSGDASRTHQSQNQQAVERNATARPNRRPSFQSPTKASLARSHPDILARAISRSPTRPGSRHGGGGQERDSTDSRLSGLRDRRALRPSLTSNAGPAESQRVPDREEVPEPELPRSSFIQQAFEEPELPPTPTELGLEPPPGRPRGLSSSSPSAQYEKRARRRIDDAPKPSPLKQRLLETDRGSGDDEVPEPEPKPARESLPLGQSREQKGLSAELQKLKDEVAELEAWTEMLDSPEEAPAPSDKELSRLVSLLSENAPTQSETKPNPPISSILSALLPFSTKAPAKPREESPPPTNPFALDENAQSKPYLTVFAPLALKTHSTKLSTKADTLTETHQLTLTPGAPFPPNLYNATVVYEANPESLSLLSLSVPDNNQQSTLPTSLRHWIDTRLRNPLLNLDVSGLCWGVNRYWEAALSRAQIWARIESRYSHLLSRGHGRGNSRDQNQNQHTGKETDLRYLIPHLDRTTMTFSSSNAPLGVLISCSLNLDEWTSEPRLLPEVSISTVPAQNRQPSSKKMEQETKKLFYTLLRGDKEETGSVAAAAAADGRANDADVDIDAVVRAVDGVLGVLFGLEQQQRVKGKLPVR